MLKGVTLNFLQQMALSTSRTLINTINQNGVCFKLKRCILYGGAISLLNYKKLVLEKIVVKKFKIVNETNNENKFFIKNRLYYNSILT